MLNVSSTIATVRSTIAEIKSYYVSIPRQVAVLAQDAELAGIEGDYGKAAKLCLHASQITKSEKEARELELAANCLSQLEADPKFNIVTIVSRDMIGDGYAHHILWKSLFKFH